MTTIPFDTLRFTQRLEQAGVPREQAEAMAEVQKESFAEIMDVQLATKSDIGDVSDAIQTIKLKQVEQDGQFLLIKWMLGVMLAGVLSLVLKAFF